MAKRRFLGCTKGGRIAVRFSPDTITRAPIFRFYDFTELLESNFPNRRIRWAKFRQTAILRGRQLWVDFCPMPRPLKLRGISTFPILRAYGTFEKLISRIATPDRSHFCQKRRFRGSANGGGWGGHLSDFRPLQLRSVFLARCYDRMGLFEN